MVLQVYTFSWKSTFFSVHACLLAHSVEPSGLVGCKNKATDKG